MIAAVLLSFILAADDSSRTPKPPFERYPAAAYDAGKPLALPRLVTPEQRRFRSELRDAITKGYDVVEGGTEHERRGPNFAGHFVLVQWGCGTDCMEAAVIDVLDGTVLQLPPLPAREIPPSFSLENGGDDLRFLKFRTGSRLLGMPHRPDGYIYYYVLEGHRWRFLRRAKDPELNY